MTTAKIALLGSFNTDLVTYTSRMPVPGETILGLDFKSGPGGKGSNQAVAAARLGGAVAFIGRIGQDAYGEMALDLWEREGIDSRYVVRDPDTHTGLAAILVDEVGENMIVVVSGANMAISPADIDRAQVAIADADVLLTQLEVPLPAVVRALEIARAHGVQTMLNPAPGQQLSPDVLALVDVITPNQHEAALITGQATDDPQVAANGLRARQAGTVIMTLGATGVLSVDQAGTRRVPVFQVEAVDTTGAGDAFNGGLAVALGEGMSLDRALRFASAAAALSVTRPGAADAMPTRQEVEVLLAGQA
jgi:ribokinase